MGRKTERQSLDVLSLGTTLLSKPWWLSAALACGTFIVFRVILPAVLASNPSLLRIVDAIWIVARIPAFMFCFIALITFIRAREQKS